MLRFSKCINVVSYWWWMINYTCKKYPILQKRHSSLELFKNRIIFQSYLIIIISAENHDSNCLSVLMHTQSRNWLSKTIKLIIIASFIVCHEVWTQIPLFDNPHICSDRPHTAWLKRFRDRYFPLYKNKSCDFITTDLEQKAFNAIKCGIFCFVLLFLNESMHWKQNLNLIKNTSNKNIFYVSKEANQFNA